MCLQYYSLFLVKIEFKKEIQTLFSYKIYGKRVIITCDLYIFYPIFGDRFFVFKEIFFRKFYTYVWLEQFVIKSRLGWCVYGIMQVLNADATVFKKKIAPVHSVYYWRQP